MAEKRTRRRSAWPGSILGAWDGLDEAQRRPKSRPKCLVSLPFASLLPMASPLDTTFEPCSQHSQPHLKPFEEAEDLYPVQAGALRGPSGSHRQTAVRSYHGGSTSSLGATGDFRRRFAESNTNGFVKFFNPQPGGFSWGSTDEAATQRTLHCLEDGPKSEDKRNRYHCI